MRITRINYNGQTIIPPTLKGY